MADLPVPLPVPTLEPDQARRLARQILSQHQFRREGPTFLERARDWVIEHLIRLFVQLFSGTRGSAVAWVVLLLGLALIVWAARRFRFSMRRARAAAVADPPGAPHLTAGDWRRQADEHEQSGAWRAALRCRWRALVAELAVRGVVEEVPGRTAGEYRSELRRSAPEASLPFDGATELFERVWYGRDEAGPATAARLRDLSDRALAEVPT